MRRHDPPKGNVVEQSADDVQEPEPGEEGGEERFAAL
jgi:hypothetical protein